MTGVQSVRVPTLKGQHWYACVTDLSLKKSGRRRDDPYEVVAGGAVVGSFMAASGRTRAGIPRAWVKDMEDNGGDTGNPDYRAHRKTFQPIRGVAL